MKFVAFGAEDKKVRVYDLEKKNMKFILEGHTDIVRSLAISNYDAFIVTSSDDKTLRVWNFDAGI